MNIRFNGVAIIFNVADIERTRAFYGEHLGIRFDRYDEEDGSAYLMTKIGQEVDLMVFKGDPKPGNTPNVVFGLSDGGIDTLIERLATAGVEIVTLRLANKDCSALRNIGINGVGDFKFTTNWICRECSGKFK